MSADEPGASAVLAELENGAAHDFLTALEWLRFDLAGFVYAGSDEDAYAYWQYFLSRREPVPGTGERHRAPRMAEVYREIGEQADDPVAELERFRRGRAKAAAR